MPSSLIAPVNPLLRSYPLTNLKTIPNSPPERIHTLHCSVEDSSGGGGEFYVRGHATLVDDPLVRAQAMQASPYDPQDRYILFLLTIEFAFMNTYADGEPNPRRWQSPELFAEVRANNYAVEPIGFIRSELTQIEAAPRQGDEGAPEAWLDLTPLAAQGLLHIRAGDELIVLTWLHRVRRDVLQVHPRNDINSPLSGVIATRSPHRPNLVGVHRVSVLEVEEQKLRITPMEAVDGTPVIVSSRCCQARPIRPVSQSEVAILGQPVEI